MEEASFLRHIEDGRAFSDDLRCRIVEPYAQGAASLRMLAGRYAMSFEYVQKIRKQQPLCGQLERLRERRHGPDLRVTPKHAERILGGARDGRISRSTSLQTIALRIRK